VLPCAYAPCRLARSVIKRIIEKSISELSIKLDPTSSYASINVYNHREFILSNLCSSAFVGGSLDPSSIAFTMSVSSLIIIEAGCKVLVSTSVEEYSEVIWTVDEEQHPDPDRVVLTGIVNAKAKRIAVLREKVTSLSSLQLALPPTVCSTNESQCQMMENMILHIHRPTGGSQAGFPLLDQWVRLPGLGGNSIMLTRKRGGDAHFPLVLFPNLGAHTLELWFHSSPASNWNDGGRFTSAVRGFVAVTPLKRGPW